MIRDEVTVRIPNPHMSDMGKELLVRILGQARIDKADWEKLLFKPLSSPRCTSLLPAGW